MPSPSNRPPESVLSKSFLLWIVCGGVFLVLMFLLGRTDSDATSLTRIYVLSGAVVLAILFGFRNTKSSARVILSILLLGLVARLFMFGQPSKFDDDFYRYMWDGAVTANGYNPYAIRPAEVLRGGALPQDAAFQALAAKAMPTLTRVNHPELTTIYPPVAQGVFALSYFIAPFSPVGLRVVFLLIEVVAVALLLLMLRTLGRPLSWVAVYWWCPLVIKEVYFGLHMDVLPATLALASIGAAVWRFRITAIVLLALAVGAKLWPVVLAPIVIRYAVTSWRSLFSGVALFALLTLIISFPLLASWGDASHSGASAYAKQWMNNAGFFGVLQWASNQLYQASLNTFFDGYFDPAQMPRRIVACIVLLFLAVMSVVKIPDSAAVIRYAMWAVAVVFLISPTQFPWYFVWVMPFLALTAGSWSALAILLYVALLPLYHLHQTSPWLLWIEHLPVWLGLAIGLLVWLKRDLVMPIFQETPFHLPQGTRVAVIIPALNEERAIGPVIDEIPKWVSQVIVADNNSNDATVSVAEAHGATVVVEPHRGYGAACLRGISVLGDSAVVVFLDGDFSDHPNEMGRLVGPIVRGEADMVIGSRVLGKAEPGALTPQQRFGNALACALIRLLYGQRFSDLGPFRAIRASSLRQLQMDDRDFGWTVQMQVRAARQGLISIEVPVSYRKRIGVSKISGTVRGVFLAGKKILLTVFAEGLRKVHPSDSHA